MQQVLQRFSKGPGELVVLGLLAKNPMHGYQIIHMLCVPERKAIYILCIGEGTLYPLLYRLEKRDLIEGKWIKVGGKRRQRQYHITNKGKAEYRRLRRCWGRLTRAVRRICTD